MEKSRPSVRSSFFLLFFFFFFSGEWGCMATVRSAMCVLSGAGALGCSSTSQQVFYGEKTAVFSYG